jgi:hypothetical protein
MIGHTEPATSKVTTHSRLSPLHMYLNQGKVPCSFSILELPNVKTKMVDLEIYVDIPYWPILP